MKRFYIYFLSIGCLFLGIASPLEAQKKKPPVPTLAAIRKAARAEGLPLSAEDLRRKPPVPDADNAAPLYVQLTERFDAKKAELEELEKIGLSLINSTSGDYSPEQIAAGRKILALLAAEFSLILQASQKPDCDFHYPYELGPETPFPEFAQMRRAVRYLGIKSVLLDREGKTSEALEQIATGARIGRHAGKEPTLIALLVQLALEAIMDRQWHKLVNRHATEKDFLAKAEKANSNFGALPSMKNGLRGEIVMGAVIIEQIRSREFNYEEFKISREDFEERLPARNAGMYEKNMLSFWRNAYKEMNKTNGDPMPIHLVLQKATADEEKTYKADEVGHLLNTILMSSVTQQGSKIVRTQAMRRMRILKIELLKYRLTHGTFPDDLKQFDVMTVTDPFDGKPLRYRREGAGFRLWSVGENLKDDGGQTRVGDNKNADVVTFYQ